MKGKQKDGGQPRVQPVDFDCLYTLEAEGGEQGRVVSPLKTVTFESC